MATTDHVDHIVEQWGNERPDLDVSPIRIVGRISRLSRSIDQRLKSVFDEHGLEAWEYDLLASLRRNGAPYEMSAGQLLSSLMITSGAVTNRIDRMESRGLVERTKVPEDKRIVRVRLTKAGMRLIDATIEPHLDNERAILQHLSANEQRQLERLLRKVQEALV